ncbi:MAG: flagellar motor switch phosphatase FliY [Spirochaetales bacterium]|nr:flagellar motor switch phosphatase FliY [Spirochaetales bacterium]MCF7937603.1 flagellar motor switch phosphatase FliY [Spirochaetales bacterium]
MSDGSLSQDEIDALLQGSGGMDFGQDASGSGEGAAGGLSDGDIQQFTDVYSDVQESQGSNLSMLVGKSVTVESPNIDTGNSEAVRNELPDSLVMLSLDFTEGAPGPHLFIIETSAAQAIAGLMMGQEEVELNDAALSALGEGFSQVMGPVTTALGEKAGATIMTSPAEAVTTDPGNATLPEGDLLRLRYQLQIEGIDPVSVTELYSQQVVKAVTGAQSSAPAGAQGAAAQQAGAGQAAAAQAAGGQAGGAQGAAGGQAGGQDPFAALGMQMGQQQANAGGGSGGGGANVQPVQFPDLQAQGGGQESGNIGLLMDVYMEMTVELGRTRKLVRDILGMGEGTIIELDKLAGEPVDILVNNKLIAKGEVVVIDENFGVRVTEIVSPMERVGNMQ